MHQPKFLAPTLNGAPAVNERTTCLSFPTKGVLGFFLASSLACAADTRLPPAATGQVDYIKDIKPLLNKHC